MTRTAEQLMAEAGWSTRDATERHRGLPDPRLRLLHHRVLAAFLSGRPPIVDSVAEDARRLGLDPEPALRELAAADLAHHDSRGAVTVAYPFSGPPTGHRVALGHGREVYAMCAIDALGIPLMAGADAVIVSTDPDSGERILVEVPNRRPAAQPETTVVLISRRRTGDRSADCVCPVSNFHTGADRAAAYRRRLGLDGLVLSLPDATRIADRNFGHLLAPVPDRPATCVPATPAERSW